MLKSRALLGYAPESRRADLSFSGIRRQVCAGFIALCRTLGLFTEAIVAIGALPQLAEQSLGLLHIRRSKNLSELAVDRGEKVIGLGAHALLLP